MNAVRQRRVLFIAGFDPKGPAYYHRLYAKEAARQAALTGASYAVGPRTRNAAGNEEWTVVCGDCLTTIEQLRWDDLVRAHWPRSAVSVAWRSILAYAQLLLALGGLWRVSRASPRTLVALAYPLAFWLQPVGIALAAWLVMETLNVPRPFAFTGATVALVGAATLAARLERRFSTAWLLHIFSFAARWARGRAQGLEARLDGFERRLQEVTLNKDNDEVLLVGYSVGSLLAVSTAARWLRRDCPVARQPLSLLSLGHCIPLLALLPAAGTFRQELREVALSPRIDWIDVSSPTDWGSFALVDPVALCEAVPSADLQPCNPRLLASPRFHTLFAPERYLQIRRNKRRVHLQYLMAAERAGDYDYFDLTAGTTPFARRPWSRLCPNL